MSEPAKSPVEQAFNGAMLSLYTRAKAEAEYNATRFLAMLSDLGGLDTARTLLHAKNVSDGYTALWERSRLDLTVEALVLDPQWKVLFTDQEIDIARKRLLQYGYDAIPS